MKCSCYDNVLLCEKLRLCACVWACVRVFTAFVSFITDGVVVIIKLLTTHDSRATRIAVDSINDVVDRCYR